MAYSQMGTIPRGGVGAGVGAENAERGSMYTSLFSINHRPSAEREAPVFETEPARCSFPASAHRMPSNTSNFVNQNPNPQNP